MKSLHTLSIVESKVKTASRTKVAEGAEVTRQYVSLILNGRREPGLGMAARLAEELGITLDQFYGYWKGQREEVAA